MSNCKTIVPYLPVVVMTEILAKLPVKTLLKFRVVCKLWCSLISSHQFARRHLSLNGTERIIVNHSNKLYDVRFYSDSKVLDETSVDIRIGDLGNFYTIGSCDGLICLRERSSDKMLIWNPSTRDYQMLPSTSEIGPPFKWTYGFGYDCNSDDYKVLAFVPQQYDDLTHDVISYKTLMYTLRTDSWRRIQNDPPLGTCFRSIGSTFLNGALHWSASVRGTNPRDVIVSFDLASETYMEVPLPQDLGVSHVGNELGASRGCLCLIPRVFYTSEYIWVMEEYGVRESWTYRVEIPFSSGPSGQFMFCGFIPMTWLVENGEILLMVLDKPVLYNPNKDSVSYFAPHEEGRGSCFGCIGYIESLVSPDAYSNRDANTTSGLINIEVGRTMRKEAKEIDNEPSDHMVSGLMVH